MSFGLLSSLFVALFSSNRPCNETKQELGKILSCKCRIERFYTALLYLAFVVYLMIFAHILTGHGNTQTFIQTVGVTHDN